MYGYICSAQRRQGILTYTPNSTVGADTLIVGNPGQAGDEDRRLQPFVPVGDHRVRSACMTRPVWRSSRKRAATDRSSRSDDPFPSSNAPASEVTTPPSNAATTRRPSKCLEVEPSCATLCSPQTLISGFDKTLFSDSGADSPTFVRYPG
jgi:hypothetical protein